MNHGAYNQSNMTRPTVIIVAIGDRSRIRSRIVRETAHNRGLARGRSRGVRLAGGAGSLRGVRAARSRSRTAPFANAFANEINERSTLQIYVGQTDQWMLARWQGHFIDSFKHVKDVRQDKRYLYKEMSKCGYASFIMIPLQFVHDKDKFTELENNWMNRLNSVHPGGLNSYFEGLPRTPTRRGSQEAVRRAHRSTDKVTNVQLSVGVSGSRGDRGKKCYLTSPFVML